MIPHSACQSHGDVKLTPVCVPILPLRILPHIPVVQLDLFRVWNGGSGGLQCLDCGDAPLVRSRRPLARSPAVTARSHQLRVRHGSERGRPPPDDGRPSHVPELMSGRQVTDGCQYQPRRLGAPVVVPSLPRPPDASDL